MVVMVIMVVIVAIEGKGPLRPGSEQGAVFRGVLNHFWCALAADMPIQTQHPIRGRHDDMQIVADHKDRAVQVAAYMLDLAIEIGGTGLVQPLGRLIQNQ